MISCFVEAHVRLHVRIYTNMDARRYGVGLTDLAISIVILVLMVVLLPGRSFGWRLPRLVSVLFASFGAMQTYSVGHGVGRGIEGGA
jgi:hypothetical protein